MWGFEKYQIKNLKNTMILSIYECKYDRTLQLSRLKKCNK